MVERPDLGKMAKFARIYTNSYVILFRSYSRRCSPEIVRITIKSGGLEGLNLEVVPTDSTAAGVLGVASA